MIKIIKITDPDCIDCMGASVGDCATCSRRTSEVVLCMHCQYKQDSIMHREKLLCGKLHAWVQPTDFCAWGKKHE